MTFDRDVERRVVRHGAAFLVDKRVRTSSPPTSQKHFHPWALPPRTLSDFIPRWSPGSSDRPSLDRAHSPDCPLFLFFSFSLSLSLSVSLRAFQRGSARLLRCLSASERSKVVKALHCARRTFQQTMKLARKRRAIRRGFLTFRSFADCARYLVRFISRIKLSFFWLNFRVVRCSGWWRLYSYNRWKISNSCEPFFLWKEQVFEESI